MSSERWLDFWRAHGRSAADHDPQTQVLRTFNRQPIAPERWQDTLVYLDRLFPVGPVDDVLELCCGNGLFSAHFARRGRTITAVDISQDLLDKLVRRPSRTSRRFAPMSAKRDSQKRFSRILLYAGRQYFSEGEVYCCSEDASLAAAGRTAVHWRIPDRRGSGPSTTLPKDAANISRTDE